MPSLAEKNKVPFTLVRLLGYEVLVPGLMSLTNCVPAVVPFLATAQRRGPRRWHRRTASHPRWSGQGYELLLPGMMSSTNSVPAAVPSDLPQLNAVDPVVSLEEQRPAHVGQVVGVRAAGARLDVPDELRAGGRTVRSPQLKAVDPVVGFEEQRPAHVGQVVGVRAGAARVDVTDELRAGGRAVQRHSSTPWTPSPASKKTVPPTLVKKLGFELLLPGLMSANRDGVPDGRNRSSSASSRSGRPYDGLRVTRPFRGSSGIRTGRLSCCGHHRKVFLLMVISAGRWDSGAAASTFNGSSRRPQGSMHAIRATTRRLAAST